MKLEKWLDENETNRSQFCKELGISRTHLYDILKGKLMPSRKLSEKIEKATEGKVTIMELLFPERFE